MTGSGPSAGQVADIRARAEAATPGPWFAVSDDLIGGRCVMTTDEPPRHDSAAVASFVHDADAAHIAGMDPTTTLALLDHIATLERLGDEMHAAAERLQGDVARVWELHQSHYGGCAECTHMAFVSWPCPTIAALDGPAAGGER